MNITSLTDYCTWDLVPCDEPRAGYAGCELLYKSGNVSLEPEKSGMFTKIMFY